MTVKARVANHTDGATVPDVDLGRLRDWMDATGLGSGAITDTRLLTGGTQNILIRYRRGDREYLLRRPPLHKRANSDETMRREARVLVALAGSDVPHPGLIASCEDVEVIGSCFYLMEPVEGYNPTVTPPPPDRGVQHAVGLAMAEALLHQARDLIAHRTEG
jgi:aminoglycoside phosphotransferase (APT) family kinase protein